MEREKGSHSQKNTKSPHKLEVTVDIDESLLTYGRNNDLESHWKEEKLQYLEDHQHMVLSWLRDSCQSQ